MGRARNTKPLTGAGAQRRGIDPARLLSTTAPVIAGRDIHIADGGAAQRMEPLAPIADGDAVLEALDRIGWRSPYPNIRPPLDHVNFLASGECTYKLSTGAAYRAHIGATRDSQTGQAQFVAVCTYGASDGDHANIVYIGPDLAQAVKRVNRQMQSKMREGRGLQRYLPQSRFSDDGKLTEQQVFAAVTGRDPLRGGTPA